MTTNIIETWSKNLAVFLEMKFLPNRTHHKDDSLNQDQ